MHFEELPANVLKLLDQYQAPKLLIRHLTLVYNVGKELRVGIEKAFPTLKLNRQEISFGTATHDIGKVIESQELTGKGNKHEKAGRELLTRYGIRENLARFAETHGNWNAENLTIEDLIVSLADITWNGKRIDELEERLTREIASLVKADYWEVYVKLDMIISQIIIGADRRVNWQSKI